MSCFEKRGRRDYLRYAWHGVQAGEPVARTTPLDNTMQDWIEKETATAQFGTTKAATAQTRKSKAKPRKSQAGNRRLKNRFQNVLDAMSRKPSLKFPAGCNGRAEVKAAYRFLDNEHTTFHSVLNPHHDATLERIREHTVVLIPQD